MPPRVLSVSSQWASASPGLRRVGGGRRMPGQSGLHAHTVSPRVPEGRRSTGSDRQTRTSSGREACTGSDCQAYTRRGASCQTCTGSSCQARTGYGCQARTGSSWDDAAAASVGRAKADCAME